MSWTCELCDFRLKFTRRQVLIATLIASLAAAGVLLRSGPSWKIELDVPIVSAASLDAHRVKFNVRPSR